jgi:hypothetical protein
VVAGLITLDGPQAHDSSGRDDRFVSLVAVVSRLDEKRPGPATTLYGTVAFSFVIPRACDFIGFEKKLMLKTKGLGASKVAKNQ